MGDFSVWCDGLVHEVVIWRLEFGRQGWRGMCEDGVGFHVEAGRPRIPCPRHRLARDQISDWNLLSCPQKLGLLFLCKLLNPWDQA